MGGRFAAGLAVLAALAGCASSPIDSQTPAPTPAAAAHPDRQLVGDWQVTAAQRRGRPVIRADETTQSGFDFAANGTVVITDQADTTVRYRTGHGYLRLIYPDGEYDGSAGGTEATLRITTMIANLDATPRLRYSVTNRLLVLSTSRYLLTLRRGDPHHPIFTPRPSPARTTTAPPTLATGRRSGR